MSISQDKTELIYISLLKDIEIEEYATIIKIEGNKVYCIDTFKNFLIFNTETGYCYSDNNTFGAKKYLKI